MTATKLLVGSLPSSTKRLRIREMINQPEELGFSNALNPNYKCNYHLPYYRALFENFGFLLYFNQYTFGLSVFDPLDAKLLEKADKAMADWIVVDNQIF